MALPPISKRSLPDLIEELQNFQELLAKLSSHKNPEIQVAIANSAGMARLLEAMAAITEEIKKRAGNS